MLLHSVCYTKSLLVPYTNLISWAQLWRKAALCWLLAVVNLGIYEVAQYIEPAAKECDFIYQAQQAQAW